MSKKVIHVVLKSIVGLVAVVALGLIGVYSWLMQDRPVKHMHGKKPVESGLVHINGKSEDQPKEPTEKNYQALLKGNIPKWISNATDSLYSASVQQITVDVFHGKVTASGVKIWPNKDKVKQLIASGHSPVNTFDVTIPHILFTGVVWADLVKGDRFECDTFRVVHPTLDVSSFPFTKHAGGKGKDHVDVLAAKYIIIDQPDVTYRFTGKDDHYTYFLKGGSIVLNDWKFDQNISTDTNRFLYAKSGSLKFGTIEYKEPGNTYRVSSSGVEFYTTGNTLRLKNLKVAPLEDKEEYYRRLGVQKEMYTVHFPLVEFKNLNWKKLVMEKQLHASVMNLSSPSVDIYLSRYPPPNTQSVVTKYPAQLLRNLHIAVNIPKVNVSGGNVRYTELSKETERTGVVTFGNIHGTVSNVTNVPALLKHNPHCVARLAGKYDSKTDITATFNFLVPDPKGFFTVDGSVGSVEADQLRNAFKALAETDIKSLHVTRFDVHIKGNENHSDGQFTLLYNDLKVELEKLNADKSMKDRKVTSFFANHVYIFPQNPMPDDQVRSVTVSLPHDRLRSFFNLIWADMHEAAEKTIVKDQTLAEHLAAQTSAEKHNKKQVLKAFFHSIFRKKGK